RAPSVSALLRREAGDPERGARVAAGPSHLPWRERHASGAQRPGHRDRLDVAGAHDGQAGAPAEDRWRSHGSGLVGGSMSRIGKKPIPVPSNVEISIDGTNIRVKGPKGELAREIRPEISLKVEDGTLLVGLSGEEARCRAYHGLLGLLGANMVRGVSERYCKTLDIIGVGYRAEKKGDTLVLTVGYSQQVTYPEPKGITLS